MKHLLYLCLPLLLIACSDANDRRVQSNHLELLPLHAEPDIAAGGVIADSAGREVILRGVNVNAYAEYWQGTEYPTTFPFTEQDAEAIAAIGWNVVRLLLSWSLVEPAPGEYDEAYLDEIAAAVELLRGYGIYTIIDLHQDAWGPTLAAREDENCPTGWEPAFGWDGAPAWATLDSGADRCTINHTRELSPAVRNAFSAFFRNDPAGDGIGVRTRYTRMLGHVAERFATLPAVAGYDLMNEPNAFTDEEMSGLSAMYGEALEEIRAAEQRAGGFHHLVLFEPSSLWVPLAEGPPDYFPYDSNVVYAPHIYTGGVNNSTLTEENFQTARDEAALFGGAPVLTGEWGADPRRAEPGGDDYFLQHQALQDQYHFGSALWTWRESCGDPHKAGDYRAGRVPYVWGEFEVDCTSNEVTGTRTDVILQLTRPVLRAAPGRLQEFSYEHDSGRFEASASGGVDGALVLFYPLSKHGQPITVRSDGLENLRWIEAPGGNGYLLATVMEEDWLLILR